MTKCPKCRSKNLRVIGTIHLCQGCGTTVGNFDTLTNLKILLRARQKVVAKKARNKSLEELQKQRTIEKAQKRKEAHHVE